MLPEIMARHPKHTWTLLAGGGEGNDLRIEIRPCASPARVADVTVAAGAELYFLTFAGHTHTDFAYEDVDRPEVLASRIAVAAAATTGPTRVTLECAGDSLVRSRLVLDADGPGPHEDQFVSYPFTRLKTRLLCRRVVKQVLDFPALGEN